MEFQPDINFPLVVSAAGAHFILGGLWYSPYFLGRAWAKEVGIPGQDKTGIGSYLIAFIGSLVLAFVTAHTVAYLIQVYPRQNRFTLGLQTGFWLWLGYIATYALLQVVFEKRTWKLYLINTGYQLVGLLLIGVVLASWQ
jgi:hypothetical protein